ncbi:MAG: DUF448 domain-containing protein [Sulfurimonas sp.]|jgi:predicted RNA-binding protein YlxR (DUF448 family)
MAKKFHLPIRMCISCRERQPQNQLLRIQCIDGSIEIFDGIGRSFYICKNCLTQENKTLKALMRQCKSGEKDKFTSRLKEIITDDRKS